MKKVGTKIIDFELVAQGLGLNIQEAQEYFNDGRAMGRLGEFWTSGKRQNENSSFDVKNNLGERIEVRSITDKVSFASSKEIGYGRKVTTEGFQKKLNSLDKYLLLDMRGLNAGNVEMIEITKEEVLKLPIGKNKSISAKKFFEIYDTNQ